MENVGQEQTSQIASHANVAVQAVGVPESDVEVCVRLNEVLKAQILRCLQVA